MSLDIELVKIEETTVFDGNITHNLGEMANKAGLYYPIWRPEEINAIYAKDIITLVEVGLKKLKSEPEFYKKFDASNGWGKYEHFVPFVEEYLKALKENPESKIVVWR